MSHLSTEQIKKLCWEGSSCSTLTETRKNNTTHASHYPDLKHCSTIIRKKRDRGGPSLEMKFVDTNTKSRVTYMRVSRKYGDSALFKVGIL